jgi:hypothetical protein
MQNDYKQDRDSEPDRRHSKGDKRQECKINMTPRLLRASMRAVVDLETETVAGALLLGGLRPAGRVEIAMSASISRSNKAWGRLK